jgi:hypothetical protein
LSIFWTSQKFAFHQVKVSVLLDWTFLLALASFFFFFLRLTLLCVLHTNIWTEFCVQSQQG